MLIIGLPGKTLTDDDRRWLASPQVSGVILFTRNFESREQVTALMASLTIEGALAGAPPLDLSAIETHLAAMRAVCAGDPAAGPIAALSPSERFHWLVSPRSAAIQISPVHGGVTEDPAAALRRLFTTLVSPPG